MDMKAKYNQLKTMLAARRGAMGLGDVPSVFLTLVLIVVIGVAAYLVLGGLRSSITGTDAQSNASVAAISNFTTALNNVVSYAPTWGTIIGVAVLIGIVLTAFYFGRQKFGGGD